MTNPSKFASVLQAASSHRTIVASAVGESRPEGVGTVTLQASARMRVTRFLVILAPLGAALADNTTYQCGRLDRVGPPSEGGKYVCGLETLRAGCVVYSFGISGDSRFESYLLQNTPCEVHA